MNIRTEQKVDSKYSKFIDQLVALKLDIISLLDTYLGMNYESLLAEIDKLKAWLDSFRPLSPILVEELKKQYDVQFTYNSNAIEGNTLTQSETELVLSKGITISGKTLQEHLEVIGH